MYRAGAAPEQHPRGHQMAPNWGPAPAPDDLLVPNPTQPTLMPPGAKSVEGHSATGPVVVGDGSCVGDAPAHHRNVPALTEMPQNVHKA